MIRYAVRRAAYHGTLLFGVLAATFVLFKVVPSDPARVVLGPNASEAQVVALQRQLGLDRPFAEQFLAFLSAGLRLDFGRSYVDDRLVWPEVRKRFGMSLALLALCLGVVAGHLALSVSASIRGTRVLAAVEFLLVSTPTMFSGVVIALVVIRWTTLPTFSGRLDAASDWLALVAPAVALALYPMTVLSRVLQGEFARLRGAAFAVAARAVGFSEKRLIWTVLTKNAAVPVLSTLATLLPMLLSGAFVIEVLFSIPGTGALVVKSVLQRDLPMLQGIVIANGLAVVAIHFGLELLYPLLDPRMAVDR